jgi:hypothetical protein
MTPGGLALLTLARDFDRGTRDDLLSGDLESFASVPGTTQSTSTARLAHPTR